LTLRGSAQALATPVEAASERSVPSKPPPLYCVPPEAKLASVVTLVQVVPDAVPAPTLYPSAPAESVAGPEPADGL
jgi:hypothetical protein